MDQRIGVRPLTRVDILIDNNTWWTDAFQFGLPEDQTWTFNGCTFLLGVKNSPSDTSALVTFSSAGGTITAVDMIARILQMNVPNANNQVGGLSNGTYCYDLIMVTAATGERDGLMYGTLEVKQGVTP